MTELLATRTSGLGALAVRWDHFARWWISELRQALPASWLRLFSDKVTPQVFVWRADDTVTCRLVAQNTCLERQYSTAEFSIAALEDWLLRAGFQREQVELAAALQQEEFLQRDLRVPNEALRSLPQILQQEVLRRTPFQTFDIWHEARRLANGNGDGVVALCHWIIPKDRAASLVAPLGLAVDTFDFLAAKAPSGEIFPVISLRSAPQANPAGGARTIKLLAALLLGSIVLGLAVLEWTQADVAGYLEEELAEARQAVHGGQGSSGQLTRIYALKSEPGFLALWDELSRILPDDTFLSEVRMNAGRVTISGYSSQAAHLVRIIDQSPIFSGATLIAAITPDANEGKDRFRIAFQLRSGLLARFSQTAQRSDR